MEDQPKIKLIISKTDKVIEMISWTLLIGIWILVITSFSDLPETIPIHFNGTGEADGFGVKTNIFGLPIIGTIVFVGMTILNKNHHVSNYLTRITNENSLSQFYNAVRMIRVVKLITVLVFGLILIRTIKITNGSADGLGNWFLPLIIGLFIIPTFYFLIKSIKIEIKH